MRLLAGDQQDGSNDAVRETPGGTPPRLRRTASGANPAEPRCLLAPNCEDAADRYGDGYAPVPFKIGRVD